MQRPVGKQILSRGLIYFKYPLMKYWIEELITIKSPGIEEFLAIGRVLDKYTQGRKGPALMITAGVHGNELSGIIAFKRVWQTLTQMNISIEGDLNGLAGNLAA